MQVDEGLPDQEISEEEKVGEGQREEISESVEISEI